MDHSSTRPPRVETREISDADDPPAGCPNCQDPEYTRKTYYIRELQEMGEPGVTRRVRYEAVTWECKACGATFRVPLPGIPPRTPFMPGVLEYARRRVLEKGDSARRVAADLNELHHVEVSDRTVNAWINAESVTEAGLLETSFDGEPAVQDFSGALSVDGTFKAVNVKKKRPPAGESGEYCLFVTQLPGGRLAAYWFEGKPRARPSGPSTR